MHDMNDMGGMGDMNDTMGGMDMGMVMYFNFVMPLTVVFEQWVISDQGGLIGSCFGVFGLAVLYEVFKNARQYWANTSAKIHVKLASKMFLAYVLMLIVMTFNVWLVVSVIIGAGIGHLVAGFFSLNSSDAKDEQGHDKSCERISLGKGKSLPSYSGSWNKHAEKKGYDNTVEESGFY